MRSSFFMQICSAELCQYQIVDRVTGREYEIRLSELVDPSGRIVTLAASRMANNVGISTLAFTTDGRLLLVKQSEKNIASRGLLAPSGSGTLEPRDLDSAGGNATLQEIVIRGMERELCEETGVSTDLIVGTKVVGFGRWLERGAKPEFFGLTHLNISAQEMSGVKISAGERLFTDRVSAVHVDLEQVRADQEAGTPIDQAKSCPRIIRDSGSLPLIAGLRAVTMRLAVDDPDAS